MTDSLSYRRLLRLDGMPELMLAACLLRLAGRIFTLAIVLYVLARFDSPVLAGWVAFASLAPGLIVSPLAGAMLDRLGAAKAIVVDMAVSAALVLALALVDVAAAMTEPLLLALVALYSFTSPLGTAGVRVLIPRLVPPDALDRANALDTSSYALISVAGPAVAGVLFGFAGAQVTLLAVAFLYAAGTASLVPLVRRASTGVAAATGSLTRSALQGVMYVVRSPSLRGLAISYSLFQVSWGFVLLLCALGHTALDRFQARGMRCLLLLQLRLLPLLQLQQCACMRVLLSFATQRCALLHRSDFAFEVL